MGFKSLTGLTYMLTFFLNSSYNFYSYESIASTLSYMAKCLIQDYCLLSHSLFILYTLHAAYKAMAVESIKYRYFIRKYM